MMLRLCHWDDIAEGQARGFILEELPLVAIKHQGSLYLYRNSCPHRGINLEWMPDRFLEPEGRFIQCATHGALFRIENGECIQGPCLGASLRAVAYSERDGEIFVDLDLTDRSPPVAAPPAK